MGFLHGLLKEIRFGFKLILFLNYTTLFVTWVVGRYFNGTDAVPYVEFYVNSLICWMLGVELVEYQDPKLQRRVGANLSKLG
jgi:hypothetical protein